MTRRPARPRLGPRRTPLPGGAGDVLELFVLAADRAADPALLLASFRNARVLAPFPRRGGEAGARWQRIIRAHERTLAVLEGRAPGRVLPRGPELRRWGCDLFEALFPGDVRRLYDVARSLQPGGVLDVVFTSMLDWVADKPWELAFDPARREFLATADVNFVRNVFTAVPADARPARRDRLRIVVVTAEPQGAAPISAPAEAALVRRVFRPLVDAGLASVSVLSRATPDALHRRLAGEPVDVLHYVGHGAFDDDAQEGVLFLEDGRRRPKPMTAAAFRQVVGRRGLALVFLNACESGRGGRVDFNRGVAPALVAAGVPAVVANQYAVLDESATVFARELYASLARGVPLGDAAREARVALGQTAGDETLDWAVPVVFARDPRARFGAAGRRAPARRRVGRRRTRSEKGR
jgi:hypothetical protein